MQDEAVELVRLTESNLLGALFLEGTTGTLEALEVTRQIVSTEDFLPNYLDQLHRRIFRAMLESPRTDYITVATTMNSRGELFKNDIFYMLTMSAEVIGIDYAWYARLVAQNAAEWRDGKVKPKFKGGI